MITDENHREIAQKLRELDMSDIEVDGCIIDSPKYVGLLLMRMLDAACDYRNGLHHFPWFFSAQEVVELFADLIDRPTCHLIEDEDGYTACSECGCTALCMRDATYCPACGRVIVND